MRAVLQRVSRAQVSIDDKIHSHIEKGLLILLGIDAEDSMEDILWLAAKIANMRIFADKDGLMNKSMNDIGAEALVVSQFTLFASTQKGNRPSFIKAAKPEFAQMMYQIFCRQLEKEISRKVKEGVFGADMQVSLVNDGPVTILLDTKNKE